MARIFSLPAQQTEDANGNPRAGAKLYFYVASTTTPQAVYSDNGLTTPITQPVVANSAGEWIPIFMSGTTYRVDLYTSADVLVNSTPIYDPGIALGSGALAIANGGTGATTASQARTNLGLGTVATRDTGTSANQIPLLDAGGYPAINGTQITGIPTTAQITALQYRNNRNYAEYALATALATLIPYDDTIPQITEGDQILSTTLTPTSATGRVRIRVQVWGTGSVATNWTVALFNGIGTDALIAAAGNTEAATRANPAVIDYEYLPGSTSAITFTVRVGANSGTITTNGVSAATRRYGGVAKSTIIVEQVTA